MVPSITSLPSSASPIEIPQQWVNRISKTFNDHLQVHTDLPICIFQVTENLITEKKESYVPNNILLGPIHHFRTELYSKQEQLKFTTAKKVLTPYKITSSFDKIVGERLKELVPELRCCYDLYFDVDDDTLSWVFAMDGIFLIDTLSRVSEGDSIECFEDVIMVENQIPLIVLIEVHSALEEHLSEYVDLMCGIIDSVKDVRILREKNIIEGDLDDNEIVKLFNGVTKSSLKTDEASGLQKTVARVNKYYGNVPRVKVYHFVKKHILAWWKVIAIVFTLLNLMLLVVQGVCQVYECNNGLGFSVVSFVFGFGTKNSRSTSWTISTLGMLWHMALRYLVGKHIHQHLQLC
nr:putative UPF0481 protein At3g02645 [Tanacetum cinerariifolium]